MLEGLHAIRRKNRLPPSKNPENLEESVVLRRRNGAAPKSFDLEKVARLFSVVNFAFALGSLEEALVNKRKENVALLRTGSAALSLMDDRWVIGLMTRLDEVGKSGSGVAVARWMGALGALLGVYASFEDARYAWTEDGEGDVA